MMTLGMFEVSCKAFQILKMINDMSAIDSWKLAVQRLQPG